MFEWENSRVGKLKVTGAHSFFNKLSALQHPHSKVEKSKDFKIIFTVPYS